MATISNTPRPGYAWDATDNCWYPIGVGGHSHNEIPVTTVDAKGDLIVGTGADAVSRKSVGADGSVLVADSTQATGVNWAGTLQYAGKNKIINGDFSVWQRGTSLSGSNTYLADRWSNNFGGATTFNQSRQAFTPGAAPVAGYEGKYFWRGTVTNAGSETAWYLNHFIEDVQTLAGQTVTISFWAKADSTRLIGVYFNQVFGSGGSSAVNTQIGGTITLTTSWTRHTATVTVPSISGKTVGTNSYVQLFWAGNITSGFTVDLWGVQLEAGSVATPFVPAGGGSQQAELALCQRYYQRYKADSVFDDLGYSGKATSTTVIYAGRTPYVPFRVAPTSVDYANVCWIVAWGGGTTAVSSIALSSYASADAPLLTFTTTGLTAQTLYIILAGNTSDAYIGLSAEIV